MYSYTVQKNTLIPSQIQQVYIKVIKFKELITNKEAFEDLNLFPSKEMKIDDTDQEIIFSFQVGDSQWINNVAERLSESNMQCYIAPVKHLAKLMLKFAQYGIHLPTFDVSQSILFQNEGISISFEVYNSENRQVEQEKHNQVMKLKEFGLQHYSKDNQDLPLKSMPYELVDMILQEQDIQINEKMTVFCIGCAMFHLQKRRHVFCEIEGNEDINDRRRELVIKIEVHCLNFDRALYAGLMLRCIKEQANERPTLIDVNNEMERISFFVKCTCDALILQENLNPIIFKENKLHEIVKQQLKYINEDQITGRIYIMQNLAKIQFIVLLSQSDLLKNDQQDQKQYFVNQLLTNLICTQLEGIQELEKLLQSKKSKLKQIPLDFHDTQDELQEFLNKYAQNYRIFLLKLYKYFLQLQVLNIVYDEFYKIQTQDLKSIVEKLKTFVVQNPQTSDLLKYCLDNLSTIFLHDQLKRRFSPAIGELLSVDVYDQYDCLIGILLNKNKSQLHNLIYQNIREN